MKITKQILAALEVPESAIKKYLGDLNKLLPEYQIDTPLRVAHFLAQVLHESSRMTRTTENLNYSEDGLQRTFLRYKKNPALAKQHARKPEAIANHAYANKNGNGNEASGDGYRYRGRGLIQLTGRDNYRQFEEWIGDDVVTNPDRVVDKYTVHSAVYYWDSRNLNSLADLDEVKAITKRINGGYNGLTDRKMLLAQAKDALAVDSTPVVLPKATHEVDVTTTLNLRSKAVVSPSTRLATLTDGMRVMKVADADKPGWWRVRVVVRNRLMEGYVSSKYLVPLSPKAAAADPTPTASPIDFEIPPAHLKENNRASTRAKTETWAYPLGEPDMPRRTGKTAATKSKQLLAIVNYLDPEAPSHKRYQRTPGATFCNVYAYDYCYLAGVYLPGYGGSPR